jgi:CheY-like chemotaxis protein
VSRAARRARWRSSFAAPEREAQILRAFAAKRPVLPRGERGRPLAPELQNLILMTARLTNARPDPVADGAPASRSSAVDSTASRRGRLVLVIDDEPLLARAISRSLTFEGFDVTACSRPEEALESIAAGRRFDVILCDMMMPGLSGMDVRASLMRDFPEQERRLLFVTGGSTHADHEAFLHRNGDRCVRKPCTTDDLLAAVARVLDAGARH